MEILLENINDVCGYAYYKIIIKNEKDYELLGSAIMKGDVIKLKDMENLVYINIIENYNSSIKIYGYETKSYPGYYSDFGKFDENRMRSFLLNGKGEFILYRQIIDYDPYFIYDQIELYEEEKEKKKLVSDVDIQNKCFEILNKYMLIKPYLIIYGTEALNLLENGKLKVFLIEYNVLKRQEQEYKDIIKKENHKYNETNIVIYDGNSKYVEELLKYGGIIGVLIDE